MAVNPKVAIIGCGVAGLTSIKACLDAGLQPTCFEKQKWLGGLWNYKEDEQVETYNIGPTASVHNCTITNTCKLTTCFSDFPFPLDFPNFMSHRYIQEYLEMYAERFDLVKYVHFNTIVVKLAKSTDHAQTGRWVVTYSKLVKTCGETPEMQHQEIFDAVMVCNGHFWDPAKPTIHGMESFKGVQIHSGDYRSFQPFTGKQVVVVGGSHSGADIACELSHHASQVYLSTRSGCYYFRRGGVHGLPTELQISHAKSMLPLPLTLKLMFATGMVNNMYDLGRFGLEPVNNVIPGVNKYGFVNDELDHRIITGSIIVKGDIKELRKNTVVFDDGHVVEDIDALVYATGFKLSFPFASEDIISVKDSLYVSLYKHIFPPEHEKNTLAVIGVVSSSGPLPAVSETQARVAAEVFAGRCTLPSKDQMTKEIVEREDRMMKNGALKDKLLRISFGSYLEELATMIGAKPYFWSLFIKDPKLALKYMFGPVVPAHYRLQGPNASKDARDIIMTDIKQCLHPLSTRKCQPLRSNSFAYLLIFVLMGFLSTFIMFVFKA